MNLAIRASVVFFFLLAPVTASAFPFGGQITLYHECYNGTVFARLSPPVPGDYIWTAATRTYQFGRPQSAGQWLLGLTGIPFDCLWSVYPLFTVPGISIMMMGSSQPTSFVPSSGDYTADPTQKRDGQFGTANPIYTGEVKFRDPASTPNLLERSGGNIQKVVISEVYASVDGSHGSDPMHEWVEIYNDTSTSVNLSGWRIGNSKSSKEFPSGTSIPARSYLLITQASTLSEFWNVPSGVRVVTLDKPFGDGLVRSGDVVRLRNVESDIVDAVSWGTNKTEFEPSALVTDVGASLSRTSIFTDKNTAADWIEKAIPTPGR